MFGISNPFAASPAKNADDALLRQVLSPKTAAVISARCCAPAAAAQDDQLLATVQTALQATALDWPTVTIAITQAQAAMGRISSTLTAAESALAQDIQGLFMNNGLTVFPVLILDQTVYSYGGVPTLEQLTAHLQGNQGNHPATAT